MAGSTIHMSILKQIFRLHLQGVPLLRISAMVGASRNTIKKYLRQIEGSRMSTESLLAMDDEALAAALNHTVPADSQRIDELESLFPYFDKELARTGVNRMVLWGEYRKDNPNGYNYSRFCDHFRRWRKSRSGTMHFDHEPGAQLYIDFAGQTLSVTDLQTGELTPFEVFIATLGHSHYTYVEAIETQRKEPFIEAACNSFEFFGGTARVLIPDNLKSAVTQSDNYEALINRDFMDLANHYGATVMPTRSRRPRDKAIVEKSVSLVYSRIFAPLRNEVFHSLADLNRAIRERLTLYNKVPFQIRPNSREVDYEQLERPTLLPLPSDRFEIKCYKEVTVQKSGHISLHEDKHYYSVPYRFIGRKVKLVYSARHVSVYCNHERIAYHPRVHRRYGYTTLKDHLSSTHRFVSEWNPEKFISWAGSIDPVVRAYITYILDAATYPEQAYKSCAGILCAEKKVGRDRLVRAIERATYFGSYNYSTIRNILKSGLDSLAYTDDEDAAPSLPVHENIRGPQAYQ